MLSIKLHISVIAFFSFISLQNLCMENNNYIILPKEIFMEIGQFLSEKDYLQLALTCKSFYKELGYDVLVTDYIKTLVQYAQNGNSIGFYCLLKRIKPNYIENEIGKVKDFFQKFLETKNLPLITIYSKKQTNNNLLPLKEYGILDDTTYTLEKMIDAELLPIANLIFHQGHSTIYTSKKVSSYDNCTIMHKAAEYHNPETLKISLSIPGLTIYDKAADGYTPIAYAITVEKKTRENDNYAATINAFIKHESFNPNKPCNHYGDTLLHFASDCNDIETIEKLLRHPKTDSTIKNKSGETFIDLALSRKQLSMLSAESLSKLSSK